MGMGMNDMFKSRSERVDAMNTHCVTIGRVQYRVDEQQCTQKFAQNNGQSNKSASSVWPMLAHHPSSGNHVLVLRSVWRFGESSSSPSSYCDQTLGSWTCCVKAPKLTMDMPNHNYMENHANKTSYLL
eukprot:1752767-Amphidinium_carterae.1